MTELILDCAYADGASGEAPDADARATAIRIIVESVRRLSGPDGFGACRYQYLENDDPGFLFGRTMRVTKESADEIDALWLDNVRLFVDESDPELFISRCAVAIRPGCHRGTILIGPVRAELAFDACEPSAFSWTLPNGIQLDPDEHAALITDIIAEHGLDARFG